MRAAFAGGMVPVEIALAGLGVGVVFGMFGAGGSAFATPVLALMGVPGVLAVASPLPAMLPASVTGARRYVRAGKLDRRVATLAIAGGVPGTVLGALASGPLGGARLLVLSGVMLLVVGARVLLPDPVDHAVKAAARRNQTALVLAASFGVGILTGLLANGGGFLLVPLFIVVFGLTTGEAAGTSMVAVGVLTIPTLMVHWALGDIDWPVAIAFAVGLVPGSLAGAQLALHIPAPTARRAFGLLLVGFALFFLASQLV
jgi:uncharacterized protein